MNSLIGNLWNDYFSEITSEIKCEEEKQLVSITANIEEELLKSIDLEEKNLLEKFTESIYKTQNLLLKNTFVDGVRFGVEFVFEALLSDNARRRK